LEYLADDLALKFSGQGIKNNGKRFVELVETVIKNRRGEFNQEEYSLIENIVNKIKVKLKQLLLVNW
jgi:hypothetical protein